MLQRNRLPWLPARLVALGLAALAIASCSPDDGGGKTKQPAGPTKEVCEPYDVRVCDCPTATGQQNCNADGTGYGACVCPVQKAVLQPGVVEVKMDSSTGMTVDADGTTVMVPRKSGDAPPFKPNDIVVSWSGSGFLGRVMKVSEVPGAWKVETGGKKVQLDEAFSELSIDFDDAMNIAGGLSKAERDMMFVKDKIGVGFGASGFSVKVAGDLEPTMKFEKESSLKFSPYGKFNLAFKKIAGVPVDIKSFQFGIGLDAQLKLVSTVGLEGQGSVTGELEVFQFAQALAGIEKPKPLEFPIAGGIAGRVYINIGCGLTVKGAMTIKSTLNAGVLAYGGVYWGKNKDGHYTLLPETSLSKNFSSSVDDLEWSADAVLECYLKPKVGLNILHVFETYVEEGPYGTFGVHINKLPYTDFQVGFKGTIGGELGIEDLDLTLAEVSYDLFDYNTTLWTKDFSICGDGYQQLDEQCDIGPFYALHKNVSEPKPAWCGSDCTCAKGFAPRNPVPKDFVGKGAQWGEPDDQGFYTNDCIPSCGNGRIDPGEKCDPRMAPNFSDCGRGCAQDCSHVLGVCGDGILDAQCGETCDDGKVDCSGTCGSSCYMPPLKCGDGITDFNCGETCDDGNTKGNDGCSVTCQASKVCGDGILGTYEECDDGNTDDCDGCNSWCRVEQLTCGDGEVCGNEECDTAGASYSCTAQCKKTRCGDGVVTPESGEQCDDAGESAGCTTDCRLSICGDHYVNHTAGEQCDSGGVDTWSCDADCTLPSCGDNHVNAQREACDDGNTDDCDSCAYNCLGSGSPPVCGDGFANMWCGEACDDGAENGSCGKCASDCQKHVGLCGDGNVDTGCGEVCDDGNTTSGDGCRGDCMGIEQCGDNLVDKNETCDDGNTSSCGGSCKSDCSGFYNDVCHDGVRESCETCEDTNTANTGIDDGCSAQLPNCNACKVCSVSVCGNGKVEAGEVCEPTGTCSDESGGSCTLQDTSQCPANVGCTFLLVSGNCSDDCQGVIP